MVLFSAFWQYLTVRILEFCTCIAGGTGNARAFRSLDRERTSACRRHCVHSPALRSSLCPGVLLFPPARKEAIRSRPEGKLCIQPQNYLSVFSARLVRVSSCNYLNSWLFDHAAPPGTDGFCKHCCLCWWMCAGRLRVAVGPSLILFSNIPPLSKTKSKSRPLWAACYDSIISHLWLSFTG